MPRKLLLENVTCSRCGGSGQYSYCQMYGSTCFKCHGAGVTLTKRGHAAQVRLNAQKKKKGAAVVVGEWVKVEGIPGFTATKWAKVTEVAGTGTEHVIAATSKDGEKHTMNGFGDIEIEVFLGKERNAALRAEALAFQATLTKAGRPS